MDIHLDTSWCPVCDKAIMPLRQQPEPSPQPAQLPQPQPQPQQPQRLQTSSRRLNKSRFVGGGLLHGTGRIKPGGGLRRDNTLPNLNNAKERSPQKQSALNSNSTVATSNTTADLQRQNSLPSRHLSVIDHAQTPLYCSEQCRKADQELTFAHASSTTSLPENLISKLQRDLSIAPHPFELNPAQHSPPSLPPVPPNSLRVSTAVSEAEQSDSSSSSSGSGESFGTSSYSGSRTSPTDPLPKRRMNDVPAPPEIAPLPLHPHRPSAPARRPSDTRTLQTKTDNFEGGIMQAAKRLEKLYYSMPGSSKEDQDDKPFDIKNVPRGALGKDGISGIRTRKEIEEEERKKVERSYNWKNDVYGQPPVSTQGYIPAAHRRASEPSTTDVYSAQARTQSAIELYSKFPVFSKSRSRGSNQSLAALPTTSTSFSHSYVSEFSKARSSSPEDADSVRRRRRDEKRLPIEEDPMYEGKKLSRESKSILPSGLEGKLVVPQVLLRPLPSRHTSSSTQRPGSLLGASSRVSSAPLLRRHESEMSVSTHSALDSVAEEGRSRDICDSRSDGRAESRERERQERRERRERKLKGEKERKDRAMSECSARSASTANMTAVERRRYNMQNDTWSYDKLDGPKYYAMPPRIIEETRKEEVFIPDADKSKEQLIVNPLHVHDEELSRKEVKVTGRRRGAHNGMEGEFVEKEWIIKAIPERKKLFLFAGKN